MKYLMLPAARTSEIMKKHYALARSSYLSTTAKHGKRFFDVLAILTEGHPWLPVIH